MALTKIPGDVGPIFENYLDCVITEGSNRYLWAAMSKTRGIIVFDEDGVVYEVPANDWGAPALAWRNDGALIVMSVAEGGTSIQIDKVPGVSRED